MRRFFLVLLCLSLLLSTCPLSAFADTASPEEGLYWRSVRWRDDLVEADPDCELLDDDIYGSPGYSEARQFVYVDAAGEEHALSDADLEFYGDYFAHMDGNPNFVHEGEVLVDIVFTGIGSDGWVKIKNTEFSLPIVSELPDYGFYSAPKASADTILSEWNYNGSNGTIYFIARNGAKLSGVFKDDDKPWLDLQVGEIEDGVRVALSTEDITSFDGGFQLHYSGIDAGGNAFENEQVWFFVNDCRPFAFHWVNEDNYVFEVQEWLEREMWQSPGFDCIVQFVYLDEDGTETPLTPDDLEFPSNVDVQVATHWDGSTEDDSYLLLSFDRPFGDFEITYKANGAVLPLHINLPEWGYYSIEKPSVDDDHDEAWNDELREALQTEWVFDGSETTLYIRAAYNASVNTEIEEIIQESNHEVSWVIADDGRSAAVTLSDVDPDQDWLNLRLKIVRNAGTDDEDHYEQWANIRVRDMTSHLVVFWADSEWDEEEDRESITVRSWEDPMHMVWASPGQGWLVSFFVRSPEGDLSPVMPEELTWDESLVDVIDQGSADNMDGEAVTLILREFGESFITYQKDGLDLKLLVYCDLAGYGFYDIERPTVDQFIDGDPEQPNEAWNDQLREHFLRRWDYDGTNKTVYLRGSYNESLAYITEVINHSDHEIESEILEDGRLVKITLIELGTEDYLNLELVCEFRDDDGNVIYGPDTRGADIWLRDIQPGLVWRWADCGDWIDEEDRPELIEREDYGLDRSITMSPGDEWWGQFFVMDENGDLIPAADLTVDPEALDLQKYEADGKIFYRLRSLAFGETAVSDGTYTMPVESVLPQVGFYRAPTATEANYLAGEWHYDGTEATKTVYYVASDGWRLKDIRWEGGTEAAIDFQADENYAAITVDLLTERYLDIGMIFAQLDEEGNEVWDSGWRYEGIGITDERPILTAERWAYFAESEDEDPDWHLLEVFDEGDAGRWAGFVFNLKFVGPDGYISTGIDSSNEDIVTLSYDKSNEIWDVDVHGYGWAELTWTDPKDSKVYSFRIYGSEPDGFYTDPEPYLDAYLYYDEDVKGYAADYTVGEGCELYLRDFGYYEKGIKSVEVLSGNVTAEVVSLDKVVIRVDKTARGDIEAVLRITYDLYDGDDGADSEDVTVFFHGIKAAKRKLRSRDGLVEATVSKDSGAAALEGDMTEVEPILVTSYDENGRFLGLKVVTENTDALLPEDGADSLSLFWIDSEFAPKSNSEEVELGE